MTLCKDCKHFNVMNTAQCGAAGNSRPDWVNGGERFIWPWADNVRMDETMCGRKGRWFEAREQEQAAA